MHFSRYNEGEKKFCFVFIFQIITTFIYRLFQISAKPGFEKDPSSQNKGHFNRQTLSMALGTINAY